MTGSSTVMVVLPANPGTITDSVVNRIGLSDDLGPTPVSILVDLGRASPQL